LDSINSSLTPFSLTILLRELSARFSLPFGHLTVRPLYLPVRESWAFSILVRLSKVALMVGGSFVFHRSLSVGLTGLSLNVGFLRVGNGVKIEFWKLGSDCSSIRRDVQTCRFRSMSVDGLRKLCCHSRSKLRDWSIFEFCL